jgi:hypothetical protein
MMRLIRIKKCLSRSTEHLNGEDLIREALTRYFEGGASSVYLWELEESGFAGVVLLKKSMLSIGSSNLLSLTAIHPAKNPSSPDQPSGSWDSIHVIEVGERGRQGQYKLTSTIMLSLSEASKTNEHMSLSGSLTRQVCNQPINLRSDYNLSSTSTKPPSLTLCLTW